MPTKTPKQKSSEIQEGVHSIYWTTRTQVTPLLLFYEPEPWLDYSSTMPTFSDGISAQFQLKIK